MKLSVGDVTPLRRAVTVTYRIEVEENGRPVNHERFAMLVLDKSQVETIILYCYDETVCVPPGVWSLSFPAGCGYRIA